ncbi:MAG: hypothetical protein CMM75_10130 [Rhodospirillaceae bacterium]|nr:hypothetical protein [Rhodospirillaceae bacterium]MQF86549.1 hypothetical protein [SAR202 cluster bacterium]
MSINSHNYTNRKRIEREHLNISQPSEARTLNAYPKLATYDFPDDAEIIIEVWATKAKNSLLRFNWGTVASPGYSSDDGAPLESIKHTNRFKCNIKVINPNDKKILGLAEEVEFTAGSIVESSMVTDILDVELVDNLEGRIWDLAFIDDEQKPILHIERKRGYLAKDDFFFVATSPIILKLVLLKMTEHCHRPPEADGESEEEFPHWTYQWYQLIYSKQGFYNGTIEFPERNKALETDPDWISKRDNWIDDVVKSWGISKMPPYLKRLESKEGS